MALYVSTGLKHFLFFCTLVCHSINFVRGSHDNSKASLKAAHTHTHTTHIHTYTLKHKHKH